VVLQINLVMRVENMSACSVFIAVCSFCILYFICILCSYCCVLGVLNLMKML